jgi:hypothetical protein
MRRHHSQCHNKCGQHGELIAAPDNCGYRLLGPIWGSTSTEEHHTLCTAEAAAAANQHEAGLPPPAEQPSQAPQGHVDGALTAGHDAQSTAQPESDAEVCIGGWVRGPPGYG